MRAKGMIFVDLPKSLWTMLEKWWSSGNEQSYILDDVNLDEWIHEEMMISQVAVYPLFDAFVWLSKIDTLYEPLYFGKMITVRPFTSKRREQIRWRHHFDLDRLSRIRREFREHGVMDETNELVSRDPCNNFRSISLDDDQTLFLTMKSRNGNDVLIWIHPRGKHLMKKWALIERKNLIESIFSHFSICPIRCSIFIFETYLVTLTSDASWWDG